MKKRIAAIAALLLGLRLGLFAAESDTFRSLTQGTQLRRPVTISASAAQAEQDGERSYEPVPEFAADHTGAASQAVSNTEDTFLNNNHVDSTEGSGTEILETTIASGLSIKNATPYAIDIPKLLSEGVPQRLAAGQPQILILHTHSSEAYTPTGSDRYEASDSYRTEDLNFNVVRVGDELAARLENYGLQVLHDRNVYDYPSYTGSYTRSGEAVSQYLSQYPSIAVVIDLHRDALGSGDVIYKTVAEAGGVCASQVMLLVGTDASGLYHPKWQENLKLALYLQSAAVRKYPTLVRPVSVVSERYNQHLTTGSMILEVGSAGNTLQEALTAVGMFADAVGPALEALIEPQV